MAQVDPPPLLEGFEYWQFEPKRDLQAYELAILVREMRGAGFAHGGLLQIPIDKSRAPHWDEIKRHFIRCEENTMAIKYYCDVCHHEMAPGETKRLRLTLGNVSVEIVTAYKGAWNGGHICHGCVRSAIECGVPYTGAEPAA
jgi:hypothetical protein